MGPDWYDKRILILGCGNILLADDGFGPAVAQRLRDNFTVPTDVCVFDAGTSVREILFDTALSDKKPSKIVIVDAMDCGRQPGELFSLDIDSLPKVKLDDCGVEVVVIACHVASACDSVSPGLSKLVEAAVQQAAETLAREYFG